MFGASKFEIDLYTSCNCSLLFWYDESLVKGFKILDKALAHQKGTGLHPHSCYCLLLKALRLVSYKAAMAPEKFVRKRVKTCLFFRVHPIFDQKLIGVLGLFHNMSLINVTPKTNSSFFQKSCLSHPYPSHSYTFYLNGMIKSAFDL